MFKMIISKKEMLKKETDILQKKIPDECFGGYFIFLQSGRIFFLPHQHLSNENGVHFSQEFL